MDLNDSTLALSTAGMLKRSFPMACKEFFGLRPGTGFMDFVNELRELSDKDKSDFREMFLTIGYQID